MTELVEVLTAQRDSAIESLKKLVRQLERIRGHSTYQDQADLREARAVIAESGK
jgi:hypothetical protein